jgi:hypothetical protein
MIVMCASDCSTGWSYVLYHYKIFVLVTVEYVRPLYMICIFSFNACSVLILRLPFPLCNKLMLGRVTPSITQLEIF